jgi:hypothetical protein
VGSRKKIPYGYDKFWKNSAIQIGVSSMKKLVVLFAIVVFGCATNEQTILKNSAGETRYCYLVHDSTLAKITAVAEYTKCLNDAGTAGFKRVDAK